VIILAVIVVVGVIAGVGLVYLYRARKAAEQTQSMKNLAEVMEAVFKSYDVYRRFPPAVGVFPSYDDTPPEYGSSSSGTLYYFLLPYLQKEDLYRRARTNSLTDVGKTVIDTYYAPGDPTLPATFVDPTGETSYALTSYAINWYSFRGAAFHSSVPGLDKFMHGSQMVFGLMSFPDGMSNTISFADRFAVCKSSRHFWADDQSDAGQGGSPVVIYSPLYPSGREIARPAVELAYPEFGVHANNCDPARMQAFSSDGITVALMDGGARTLTNKISLETWAAALTPNGGETLDATWESARGPWSLERAGDK
jgi:hypothetical protein